MSDHVRESIKNRMRRVRWWALSLVGLDYFHRPTVRVPVSFIGGAGPGSYGAWAVCTEGLGPESVIYSLGVGVDISFDLDAIETLGAEVHAFDPTPASLAWLETQDTPDALMVHPYAVGAQDGTATFFAPKNPNFISHSMVPHAQTATEAVEVPVRRLSTLMEGLGHDQIDLLKIDIEGAEYEMLRDLSASGVEVRQVLVEFHHQFGGLDPSMTRDAIARLGAMGLRCFYTSPNGNECSFIRTEAGPSMR